MAAAFFEGLAPVWACAVPAIATMIFCMLLLASLPEPSGAEVNPGRGLWGWEGTLISHLSYVWSQPFFAFSWWMHGNINTNVVPECPPLDWVGQSCLTAVLEQNTSHDSPRRAQTHGYTPFSACPECPCSQQPRFELWFSLHQFDHVACRPSLALDCFRVTVFPVERKLPVSKA